MSDADEFLDSDDVSTFRDSEQYDHAAEAVMNRLGDQLKDADGTADAVGLMGSASIALRKLAEESDDPAAVSQRAKDESGDVARRSGKKKDRIVGLIDDATKDVLDEHRQERLAGGEGLSVPEGVGLDEYLEDELIEIVRQQSTDAVDDPVLRWRFADGVRIETSESIHHDHYALFKKLATATDQRLVPELASEQVEDELRDDEDTDGEAYARLSLGPQSRPWNRDGGLWSRAISGLVQERSRTETVVGPRTDAWESIQQRIRSGRAVRDLTDAVEHGMIHVDEDTSEVWVPTALVDNAADQLETSRRAIQAELAEREVTSPNLSGARVSEAVSRGGTAMRFWRLDLTHDGVPEPEIILDEIEDPLDVGLGDDGDSSTAAADGGSEPSQGTERFGRPARGDDSADDDAGDETDRADAGGVEGDPPDEDDDSSGTDGVDDGTDSAEGGDEPDEDDGGSGGEA
jgi:hypothetical protein